jgi:hypothetical protein
MVNVKYTVIELNLYLMVHSIVWKFEKIWLSHTLNIIRKPKKSLFSKRKRAIFCYPLANEVEDVDSSVHKDGTR